MASPYLRVVPVFFAVLLVSLPIAASIKGRVRRMLRVGQIGLLTYLLVLLFAYLGPRILSYGYGLRSPQPEERDLYQGIHYIREVRSDPEPMVIHVVKIDLDAPGIGFLVTPPDPAGGRALQAQTTSHFLEAQNVQLAINGDFFEPWWDNSLADYAPHSGDPVDVLGFASSQGNIYSDERPNHSTVFLYEDNRISFDERLGDVYNAISGNVLVILDGQPANQSNHPYFEKKHPRSAIGLDATGRVLILIVIDGRQPGYSTGASIPQLAQIGMDYGAATLLNMDGGGSAALVMQAANGHAAQLSAPIHNHMPYWERPIANHLGVYALPLTPP